MKKLAFVLVAGIILGVSFGLTTAINWKGGNVTVTKNVTIAAPFVKSALWLQSQTASTGSVTLRGVNVVFSTTDWYPLNFKQGEVATLNFTATNNVGYIWYENNDK